MAEATGTKEKRPMSDAQKEALANARAAKAAGPKETPATDPKLQAEYEAGQRMAEQLSEQLKTAQPAEQGALLARLDALIGLLQDKELQGARPLRPGDPPGTVYGRGLNKQKKPWSWSDLKNPDGTWQNPKTITPLETITVAWNGLRWQFIANQEVTVPDVIYGVYMESKRLKLFGEQHAKFLFGNGPATHPDMVTPNSMGVRGSGVGTYQPGAGAFNPNEGMAPEAEPQGTVPAAA
jgi:hypothetical protein